MYGYKQINLTVSKIQFLCRWHGSDTGNCSLGLSGEADKVYMQSLVDCVAQSLIHVNAIVAAFIIFVITFKSIQIITVIGFKIFICLCVIKTIVQHEMFQWHQLAGLPFQ